MIQAPLHILRMCGILETITWYSIHNIYFKSFVATNLHAHILTAAMHGYYKDLPKWFLGGPNVSYLPIPIPDPARPWGSTDCSECEGKCYGHFLPPEVAMLSPRQGMIKPPSAYIKEMFDKLKSGPSELQVEEVAKTVLLPPEEVSMWLKHLQTIKENRKKGAIKAAKTRMKKRKNRMDEEPDLMPSTNRKSDNLYYCGVCSEQYVEYTDIEERWIGCESCDSWFHFICVGIDDENIPDNFFCEECLVH